MPIWTPDVVVDMVRDCIERGNFEEAIAAIRRAENEHKEMESIELCEPEDVTLADMGVGQRAIEALFPQKIRTMADLQRATDEDLIIVGQIAQKTVDLLRAKVTQWERRMFKATYGECMNCLGRWRTKSFCVLDVHEIARGCSRQQAFKDSRAWLVVCRLCHEEMGSKKTWPVARQLALKMIRDPENYDLIFVNSIHTGSNRVTQEAVNTHAEKLKMDTGIEAA